MDWQTVPIIDVGKLRLNFNSEEAIEQGQKFSNAAKNVGFVCSKFDLYFLVIIMKPNSKRVFKF